jgi:hypothetical protein
VQGGIENPGASAPGFLRSRIYSISPKCDPKLRGGKLQVKVDVICAFLLKTVLFMWGFKEKRVELKLWMDQ